MGIRSFHRGRRPARFPSTTGPTPNHVWLLAFFCAASLVLANGCNRSGGTDSTASEDSTAANADTSGGGSDAKEQRGRRDTASETREEEALPVEVAVVGRGRIEAVVRTSANLEAEASVAVLAEAARQVRELRVEEGDRVQKGQVLLRLESDEQRSNLAKAQVGFDQAKRELERQERLFEQNLAAERTFNDAKHEFDRAKIALDDAERELGYTEVRAPIKGTVTQRLVKVGDQVAIGQQLFDIVDFESLVARVYVPERSMAEIRAGQTARIRAEAAGAMEFQGTVDRIAPVVDPRSGTIKVTVAVGAQPGLLPGMFVDVDVVTAVHEDAVLLPKRALVYDEDQAYAFKVQGNRAKRILVVPRLADRDFVEPVDGFAAGDSLVIAGQAGLKDDALIEKVEASATRGTTASG